jgi:hypothetical protein
LINLTRRRDRGLGRAGRNQQKRECCSTKEAPPRPVHYDNRSIQRAQPDQFGEIERLALTAISQAGENQIPPLISPQQAIIASFFK